MNITGSGLLPAAETVVLIPAYRPDEALIRVTSAVREAGLSTVVVDDGSGPAFAEIFRRTEPFAYILRLPRNSGKGAALKAGFRWLRDRLPGCRFVVTADADGQHASKDILRVAQAVRESGGIVIGSRRLTGKIPLRSRIGNDLSRFTYTLAAKRFLRDNQSGLRGFDASLCGWLLEVEGERYEYEMNVLLRAALQNLPVCELPIETVYFCGNCGSHFRPLPDTLLIQGRILGTSWRSVLATIVTFCGVLLLRALFTPFPAAVELSVLAAEVTGLFLSLILNSLPAKRSDEQALAVRRLLEGLLRAAARFGLTMLFFWAGNALPLALAWLLATAVLLLVEYVLRRAAARSGKGRTVQPSKEGYCEKH